MSQNKTKPMNGQWSGQYNGSSFGKIIIDLDYIETNHIGHAYICDNDPTIPDRFFKINTSKSEIMLYKIDPGTGKIIFTQPEIAECKFILLGDILKVNWNINNGAYGLAEIARSKADESTSYQPLPDVNNWKSFKEYISTLDHRRYIFRGQRELKRLRTTFHRTGRADLRRYYHQDIKTLHRHLSQRTSHIFDLTNQDQNGAFFNLAQHHGFPTPLLDWTYSPYVAAFFAYRRLTNSESLEAKPPEDKVRIFIFDKAMWPDSKENPTFEFARPYFKLFEFPAIDNERLIPQQSISALTSVDDVETYIQSKEYDNQKYLTIIDLPKQERPIVMKELSVMGITAGSLFPGIEGACEGLRERFFEL
jgi:hypothetical protein